MPDPARTADRADAIVARARACLGAGFRPHGRDPRFGLDCVGLVAVATGLAPAAAYPLRSADRFAAEAALRRAGLAEVPEPAAGDLLLLRAAPTQLHLAVRTDRGFVHADAGLRRVVEVPGAPPWPLLSAWRTAGEG